MNKKLTYLIYAAIVLFLGGVAAFLMTQDYTDLTEQSPAAVKNAVRAELNGHN